MRVLLDGLESDGEVKAKLTLEYPEWVKKYNSSHEL